MININLDWIAMLSIFLVAILHFSLYNNFKSKFDKIKKPDSILPRPFSFSPGEIFKEAMASKNKGIQFAGILYVVFQVVFILLVLTIPIRSSFN